jgi:thermitase
MAAHETGFPRGSGSDWAVYGALRDLCDWWSLASNHPDSAQRTLPVNISLGSSYASSFAIEMLAYALDHGPLVFAAMGNEGRTAAEYPAAYSGVVAVGASDGRDARADFSSTGNWLSVCAPGFDIISTGSESSSAYAWDSGTSMAAPFVTGLAAYMLAYAPALDPARVKQALEDSADRVGGAAGYSKEFGYGRVNVKRALEHATGPAPPDSAFRYCHARILISLRRGATALPGIDVYLYDDCGDYVDLGISDSRGSACFMLLRQGAYCATATWGGRTLRVAGLALTGAPGEEDLRAELAF